MSTTSALLAERLRRSRQRLEENSAREFPPLTPRPEDRYLPFPLTEMQQAYWLGRSAHVDGGNVGIHGYFEVENKALDVQRFALAWRKLIARHDMLRSVVTENGEQIILKDYPEFEIPVSDLSQAGPERIEQHIQAVRDEMTHAVFDLARWPWFDIRISQLPEGRNRIHIGMDGWCLDGWSYQIMFRDLAHFYSSDLALPEPPILYRDYIFTQREFENSPRYWRDLDYWLERVKTLPAAPALPEVNARLQAPEFKRQNFKLEAKDWSSLREECRKRNLTVSSCLLTVFGEVLAFWAEEQKFVINVPRFDRLEFHPAVYDIVGQFSSFTLFEMDCSAPLSFRERAEAAQARMWEDLQHNSVSGMRVLREAAKYSGNTGTTLYPVVFTTAPERVVDGKRITPGLSLSTLGEPVHSLTQTPQVKLDCQYLEQDSELVLFWDNIEGCFPEGMLEDMFGAYTSAVLELARSKEAWDKRNLIGLPKAQAERRRAVNSTTSPFPGEDLYSLFIKQAAATPEAEALLCPELTLSYAELRERVEALAASLLERGIRPGDNIAILQKKGWCQFASVFAILAVGAAYVPIDAQMPQERLAAILSDCAAKLVLTAEGSPDTAEKIAPELTLRADLECLRGRKAEGLPVRPQESIAYLIYTSGSTGTPKGVVIPDSNVVNMLYDTNRRFSIGAGDRIFAITALHHDLSVYDIFGGLCGGAAVVLPDPDEERNAAHWLELARSKGVTFWNSVPPIMDMLLSVAEAEGGIGEALRLVILGGDWVPVSLRARLAAQAPNAKLMTIGGPTETTVWNIFHEAGPEDDSRPSVPYGAPAANAAYHIRDELGRERPEYAVGEMVCAGAGVARGYWNKNEPSGRNFFHDPASGEWMYATGDLGYWHPDGEIRFAGRKDGQVKINGMRMESAEIEAAFSRLPDVAKAVAVLDELRRIAVFLTPAPGLKVEEVDPAALLGAAGSYLPPHMLPKLVQVLEDLPLTGNGKIDRKRLSALAGEQKQSDEGAGTGELTPLMGELAELWSEIAGISVTGPGSNFFSAGGDSLQAIRLSLSLRKKYGLALAADAIFQYPSLAAQAAVIEAESGQESAAAQGITQAYKGGKAPMTDAQRRLWLLNRMNPGETNYNLPFIVRLNGRLDTEALQAALAGLFERHVILRSCFRAEEDGADAMLTPMQPWQLPLVIEDAPEPETGKAALEEAGIVFDLSGGPLLRLRLLRHAADSHTLFLTFHHIIFDGWSIGLFFSELSSLYANIVNGENRALPLPRLSYADYSLWLAGNSKAEELQKGLEYWAARLDGLETLALPTDFARPARQSYAGTLARFSISSESAKKVDDFARQCGATAQQVLLGAFALSLGAASGQRDIAIGVPVAGRTVPDVEEIIGFFVNTLVVRTRLPEQENGYALIEQVRESMAGAQRWQDVPFARIVEAVAPQRDLSRNPLYQVSFDVQAAQFGSLSLCGIAAEFLEPPIRTTHTDLDLTLYREGSAGYSGYLAYATSLFKSETASAIIEYFTYILEQLVSCPQNSLGSLMQATPADMLKLQAFAGQSHEIESQSIVAAFRAKVLEEPQATALLCDAKSWSREKLWERSGAIARFILNSGLEPGARVVIELLRSPEWVAAILGAHRAGAVPALIDPATPEERKRLMREAVCAGLLLNQENLTQERAAELEQESQPEMGDDAFIMFTSGSTGRPKAVRITHGNIANRLQWGGRIWPFADGEHVCQKTSQAFVDVIAEAFAPLVEGIPISIVPDEDSAVPSALLAAIRKCGATRLTVVPSVLAALLDEGLSSATAPGLRLILCSGERLPAALLARARAALPQTRIWNVYGSTEVTADVTACDVTGSTEDPVPIGFAANNTLLTLVDSAGKPVPVGAPGRIVVSGAMLANGYIGQEQGGFHLRDGQRAFDTGDLGRWNADGQLEYLGRVDRQVKIRGVRVEPAEIESVINQLDGVKACAVSGRKNPTGETIICAMVAADPQAVKAAELRRQLRSRLPEAFIPARWAILDTMPLTPSGKVDWNGFENVSVVPSQLQSAPQGAIEERLAGLWESFCDSTELYRDSDFFLSGGHSLAAARLSARIENEWGIAFSLADVFNKPTLSDMGAEIARRSISSGPLPNQNSVMEEGTI